MHWYDSEKEGNEEFVIGWWRGLYFLWREVRRRPLDRFWRDWNSVVTLGCRGKANMVGYMA